MYRHVANERAREMIKALGVSNAIIAVAEACRELAAEAQACDAPGSTKTEVVAAYKGSATTIERAAKKVRHDANRVGF